MKWFDGKCLQNSRITVGAGKKIFAALYVLCNITIKMVQNKLKCLIEIFQTVNMSQINKSNNVAKLPKQFYLLNTDRKRELIPKGWI